MTIHAIEGPDQEKDSDFSKAGKRSIQKQFCRNYSVRVPSENYGPLPRRELQEGRNSRRVLGRPDRMNEVRKNMPAKPRDPLSKLRQSRPSQFPTVIFSIISAGSELSFLLDSVSPNRRKRPPGFRIST